ncbi:MAG: hypothetical protein RIT81_07990 [Deltaproteobacteria bacterium]
MGQTRAKMAALAAIGSVDTSASTVIALAGPDGTGKTTMAWAITEALTGSHHHRLQIQGRRLQRAADVEHELNLSAHDNPNDTTLFQDMPALLRRHEGPLVIQLQDLDAIAPEALEALARELGPLVVGGQMSPRLDAAPRPVVLLTTGSDASTAKKFVDLCHAQRPDGAKPRRSTARFGELSLRDLRTIARRDFTEYLGDHPAKIDDAVFDHLAMLAKRQPNSAEALKRATRRLVAEIWDNDLKSLEVDPRPLEGGSLVAADFAFCEDGISLELGLRSRR